MKGINQVIAKSLPIIFISLFMISCASIPQLKVRYQLPPQSDRLKGKKVVLVVKDDRPRAVIVGNGAKEDFENFPGTISLSIARQNEPGLFIGLYDPPALVEEGVKRKLENDGMELISRQTLGEPELLILLNEFFLDLVDRTWMVKMCYEAKLLREGKVLATRTVSGQAERFKLIGRDEADRAVGEIFTDMINRLDVLGLFQSAGL
ncbi:MAG: hypothetical protein JRJ86_03340 [Deltaproteobacteria bacterium]|nr:hypothetical protein [Deltaproteobacteria bacterium]MBW2117298.1 hypothetical protein [Deltaproteobacteria bacterium]MBW2342633.1 hypothetical protein [Deltaproteobacteria bacterium]